jgi:hypothetical protein
MSELFEKLEIYALEKGNYEGNDLLIVSLNKKDIINQMQTSIQDAIDFKENTPCFYISVWQNGSCIKVYKGEEAEQFK